MFILQHLKPYFYHKKTFTIFIREVFLLNKEKYEKQFMELCLNIKYYRNKKGLTQAQLAERINISPQQISRIESINCPGSTSIYTLFAIAEALEIEVAQLFTTHS